MSSFRFRKRDFDCNSVLLTQTRAFGMHSLIQKLSSVDIGTAIKGLPAADIHEIRGILLSQWILTHLPLVPHICVSESDQHWFRKWLVAYSAPSHYLNHSWVVVNWSLMNKLQWKLNRNYNIRIQENAFECVVYEMAAILSRGSWVKRN